MLAPLSDLAAGIAVAYSPEGLLYCAMGVLLGTFIGALPGVGPLASIAMLMPLTFHLDTTIAIIMLAGIYYGSAYGGAIAAILLNLPGTANATVTCLDGYPMAQRGRAGVAMFTTATASFIGGTVGVLLMAAFAPPLARFAQNFGSQEYFALMVLGLLAASLVASGNPFRALAMVAFGLVLGLVGMDVNSGQPRFTFGFIELYDGLPLAAVALGLFGLPEIIRNANKPRHERPNIKAGDISLRAMFPTREDWRRIRMPIVRGTGIGAFFGTLPGTGGLVASFIAYAVERRTSKPPEGFGKGAIEGVAAPESSNNAAVQTAFIPTLTLGIPGDAIMALMLAVLMINGVVPGPQLVTQDPGMFWGLVFSFLLGNLLLVVLNVPLIGVWVRLLSIRYSILFPAIVAFVCIGIYSVNYRVVDLFAVMGFGVIGYGMSLLKFEPAPLILGLILGPMMEENLRRSMLISRGDFSTFFTRPLSGAFMAISAGLLVWMIWSEIRRRRRLRATKSGEQAS